MIKMNPNKLLNSRSFRIDSLFTYDEWLDENIYERLIEQCYEIDDIEDIALGEINGEGAAKALRGNRLDSVVAFRTLMIDKIANDRRLHTILGYIYAAESFKAIDHEEQVARAKLGGYKDGDSYAQIDLELSDDNFFILDAVNALNFIDSKRIKDISKKYIIKYLEQCLADTHLETYENYLNTIVELNDDNYYEEDILAKLLAVECVRREPLESLMLVSGDKYMKEPYIFKSGKLTYRLEVSMVSTRDARLYVINDNNEIVDEVTDKEKKYWLMAVARKEMFSNIIKDSQKNAKK